jgi:hypothetical protein
MPGTARDQEANKKRQPHEQQLMVIIQFILLAHVACRRFSIANRLPKT